MEMALLLALVAGGTALIVGLTALICWAAGIPLS